MIADSIFFTTVGTGDDGGDVLVNAVPADAVGDVLCGIEEHIPQLHRVAEGAGHLLAVPYG